ncbi:hypothetical protein BDN72DRAFT_780066 [Pluteus cervinus]|uniref:Uncharacterized protein n=1 Tax=Pluteus cervinus TaxID=181527 RepID=A0ACD3A3I0_9AGAR|nr:hypothetical protein BDN72DRAFT_780066 [Pluteus cervinus]
MGYECHICPLCAGPSAIYRCRECEGGELLCQNCMVSSHKQNGLHMIEYWTGHSFEFSSLKSLGLFFQLGHPFGVKCNYPKSPANNDFVVIHTNGIHEVSVKFCGCFDRNEPHVQLLRYGWFPATTHKPQTAASLAVLKQFQIHSFESKCSAMEFYQALSRLSDNIGTRPIRDRYRAFLVMIREYRHIKSLKRAGRGNDQRGIEGTKPGECAVLCPACPQPGRNLPADWKTRPAKEQWLYRLFLAMDANFRLKRRDNKITEDADPSLGDGWSYFVENEPYMEHIGSFGDQAQPKSTCSSHSAVNNSRLTDGLATSGVGSVGCARHDCMRPCSIGDLQKGERYANMDYLFLLSLNQKELQELIDLVVSYDIACQWWINLLKRMLNYSKAIQMDGGKLQSFTYLVPKFHLPAHITSCQTRYSFNFHQHVGRTDGESPERGWSHINPVALSTCEMGPGSRRDTINDHLGDWNWKKTHTMGTTLLRKIKTAVEESKEHTLLFHRYDLGLRSQKKMAKNVDKWELELIAWQQDSTQRNPFEVRVKTPTIDAVRRQLADEDKKAQEEGKAYVLHPTIGPSQLIAIGLELEVQQRRLYLDAESLGPHATEIQTNKLMKDGEDLSNQMNDWAEVQEKYIPSIISLRQDKIQPKKVTEPWEMSLFLPSSIPPPYLCNPRLQDVEWFLRSAQAHTALDELRRAIRLRSYLYIDKDRFARGQHANTRAQSTIQRTESKVKVATAKYRAARVAISSLAKFYTTSTWEKDFPELKDKDVRPLQAEPDVSKKGRRKKADPAEGHRKVSWIWGVVGDGTTVLENGELKDDLRVEWCKSHARAKRWQEEVLLLQEEMRRVLMFLESEAQTWKSRIGFSKEGMDKPTTEGLAAYAFHQSALRLELKSHFEDMWKEVDELVRQKGYKGKEKMEQANSVLETIVEEI